MSTLPVDPKSANYLAAIAALGGNQKLHADFGGAGEYGIPYITVPGTQALVAGRLHRLRRRERPRPVPDPA